MTISMCSNRAFQTFQTAQTSVVLFLLNAADMLPQCRLCPQLIYKRFKTR